MSPDWIIPVYLGICLAGVMYLCAKHGFVGAFVVLTETLERMWDAFKAVILQLAWGKGGVRQPHPDIDCKILHINARTEAELYGEILSGSVLDHVKDCGNYNRIYQYSWHAKPQPRLPDPGREATPIISKNPKIKGSCEHEWDMAVPYLNGDAIYMCLKCHVTATLAYEDRLQFEAESN